MPIGIEVLGSVAFAMAFPLAAIGGSYLLARTILRKTGRDRKRVLSSLVDHIASQVPDSKPAQLES